MANWNSLPTEMRMQILETLAQDPSHGCTRSAMKRGLTRLALVCREWQRVFEKANFGHLILGQACLGEFAQLPRRFWPLISHLWLRIELPQYGIRSSENPESPKDAELCSHIIDGAIRSLLNTLSTWDKKLPLKDQEMTVELSIHSPSDSEYFFNGLHIRDSLFYSPAEKSNASSLRKTSHCIPWTNETRHRIEGSVMRIFGGYVHLKFNQELPRVERIKKFIIQRHTRRRISSYTLFQILQCFPSLDYLDYEPWRQTWEAQQDIVDAGYVNLIKGSLPKSLKSLTLFEDSYKDKRGELHTDMPIGEERSRRTPNQLIGIALAKRSLELENLSASFLIEADDFFRACRSDWEWKYLKTLTLTSQLFCSDVSPHKLNDLLQIAGEIALDMPNLRTMEIWNGGKGHAGIFRYQTAPGNAIVTAQSTWELVLEPRVIHTWKKVAHKYNGRELRVNLQNFFMASDSITGYYDVIQHLRSRKQVLHRGSLYELHEEAEKGLFYYP